VYRGSQARVLHADLEQGHRLTCRGYQRLAAALGVELGGLGDTRAVAVMPQLPLTRGDRAKWRDILNGRDTVVIESLRAASKGVDENSSEIRGCLDMRGELSEATGCRAVIIHHSKKPQQNDPGGRFAIRGASAACCSSFVTKSR
jgi:hypothetical protein